MFRSRRLLRRKPARRGTTRRSLAMVPRRLRYTPMRNAPTGSFASRAETYSFDYTAGNFIDFKTTLSQFGTLVKLAEFYQYYRITSVQIRIKPNYDTFSSGGTASLPYLYFMTDKAGSLGNTTVNGLKSLGCKPIRVDDKIILRKYKPSVRLDSGGQIGMFRSTPWIPTYEDDGITLNDIVEHLGCVWFITKTDNADAQKYNIDVTITAQYRKPLIPADPAVPPA